MLGVFNLSEATEKEKKTERGTERKKNSEEEIIKKKTIKR
jgi:hypothetical protein